MQNVVLVALGVFCLHVVFYISSRAKHGKRMLDAFSVIIPVVAMAFQTPYLLGDASKINGRGIEWGEESGCTAVSSYYTYNAAERICLYAPALPGVLVRLQIVAGVAIGMACAAMFDLLISSYDGVRDVLAFFRYSLLGAICAAVPHGGLAHFAMITAIVILTTDTIRRIFLRFFEIRDSAVFSVLCVVQTCSPAFFTALAICSPRNDEAYLTTYWLAAPFMVAGFAMFIAEALSLLRADIPQMEGRTEGHPKKKKTPSPSTSKAATSESKKKK